MCMGSHPYSIDGRTRSGGLWPSTQVLMLMMTFSPISTRPSRVAEPICGSRTTRLALSRRGLKAGAAELTLLEETGERVLVDHLAAGRVDDDRVGSQQLEPAG